MNLNGEDSESNIDPDDIHLLKEVSSEQSFQKRTYSAHVVLHIFLLYCFIGLLVASYLSILESSRDCPDPSQGIYSPAQNAVKYETKVFEENFATKGPYMGRDINLPDGGIPTDETDALWDDLFNFGVSQIPHSQARLLPNATELIPGMEEDQYIIELDVFHQLHCLNAIRKALYPERYWDTFNDYFVADRSPPGRATRNYTSIDARHLDHCVDAIRQSIMCHGDIATVYWRWFEPRAIPLPRLEVTHTCRNFDKIREWAKLHQIRSDPVWQPGPENSFHQSF